jgi:mono/diheme cytochrome c family protein
MAHRYWSSTLHLAAVLATLSACSQAPDAPKRGSQSPPDEDDLSGQRVYQMPLDDGNSFACATCHALEEPSADGLRRPGHPIGDAVRRSQWKNGKAATFLDAVNSCVTEWMVAPAWEPSDPRFLALRTFLESRASTGPAADLQYEIVSPPSDVAGGDAARGRATFNESCVVCHGTDGLGTIRGPRVARSLRLPEYIAGRIRRSGSPSSPIYDGLTGGVMPFWAKDRLSDDELRDLVAFISDPSTPVDQGTGGGGSKPDDDREPSSDCAKTHARVGWTADLGVNTGEGQVSGFVTVIDDCTLELHDFSYDGNGIDVRVYGSENSSFRPAFTMGPNLVGQTFRKQNFRVSLPADKTLDDLSWVGIWCVAVGADFGSGPFKAP